MSGHYLHPVVAFVSNLGYLYCAKHEAEEFPHKLPGHTHKIDARVREGYEGEACEWPGCCAIIPKVPRDQWEHINPSLQENFKT